MHKMFLSQHTVLPNSKGARVGNLKVLGTSETPVFQFLEDDSGKFEIEVSTLQLKPGQSLSSAETQFAFPITIKATLGSVSLIQEFLIVRDDFLTHGVIAHRGAFKNGEGKANSLTAFRDAIKKGCAHFECDTLFSEDEKIVVAHGPLSGEDGGIPDDLSIANSPYSTLQGVSLGNGDCIPLLSEVLELVQTQNRTRIVIEIKGTPDGKNIQLAQAISSLVREKKAEAWVSYISFHYEILLEVLAKDPTAKCAPLSDAYPLSKYVADGMWGVDFNETHYSKAESISIYQAAGLTVNTWTVNDSNRLRQLHSWGINLITTDEPETLLTIWKPRLSSNDLQEKS